MLFGSLDYAAELFNRAKMTLRIHQKQTNKDSNLVFVRVCNFGCDRSKHYVNKIASNTSTYKECVVKRVGKRSWPNIAPKLTNDSPNSFLVTKNSFIRDFDSHEMCKDDFKRWHNKYHDSIPGYQALAANALHSLLHN